MKKSIKAVLYSALCSLCLFMSVSGYSQNSRTSRVGFKVGFNLANLYADNVKDQNMKMGVLAGFYAKLPIADGIAFQPELLYSNKGAKLTYNDVIQGKGEYRFNLNYIETPFTFVFNILKNFNLHAGAYAAYLSSASVKNLKDGTIHGVTDLTKMILTAWIMGLVGGLDFNHINIGMRYNYGLKSVGHSGSLSGDLTQNSKNSALSFYIGMAF